MATTEPLKDQKQKKATAHTFVLLIEEELGRAMTKHPPMNSLHEAYAVILEELDELWDQVRLKSSDRNAPNIRSELKQIAAMAIRAAVDLGYA